MTTNEPTFEQLLVEAHKDLHRLGPGNENATLKGAEFYRRTERGFHFLQI